MTVDALNPPRRALPATSFAQRREHLLSEIEQSTSPRGSYRRLRQRPLLVVALALVLTAIPVSALAIGGQIPLSAWPFLRDHKLVPGTPYPIKGTGVVVIKTGSWNGHDWVLTAFRSDTGGVCWQITATTAGKPTNEGGAGGCAGIVGVPKVAGLSGPRATELPVTITFLHSSGGPPSFHGLPSYIAGPVIGAAQEVIIHFDDGTVVETPTFPAPAALGAPIRFYATSLTESPCNPNATQPTPITPPTDLIGVDASGHTVAELNLGARAAPAPHINRCPAKGKFAPFGFLNEVKPTPTMRQLKPVVHLTGPNGATTTLEVGPTETIRPAYTTKVQIRLGFATPVQHRVVHVPALKGLCWRITFSVGEPQSSCQSLVPTGPWVQVVGVQPANHDVFIVAQTRAPVARVTVQFSNGATINSHPIGGMVVFAVPHSQLSTTPQRAFLTGYDANGHKVGYRTSAYFRIRPNDHAPEAQ